jgi:hypothetical protein
MDLIPVAVDYERTLVLAIEVSNKNQCSKRWSTQLPRRRA